MENRAHAFAAGLFVLAALAMLLGLAAWLTRDGGRQHVYEISTRESITGLQPQAPVRLRGVDVGKVDSIGFDAKTQGNVLIRLSIDEGAPITAGTFATLAFQGVTGLAFVQLDDAGQPAAVLAPNDAAPPRIPLRAGLIARLTERGEEILNQIEQITRRLNALASGPTPERLNTALENVGQAAAGVSQLTQQMSRVVDAQLGPNRVDLPAVVKRADDAIATLKQTSEEARSALAELGQSARRLNAPGGAVDQLGAGTTALTQAVEGFNAGTLPRINRVADEASRATRQLQRAVTGIN
ncbi:MAG TPA: MlaD family protein, partial [Ramlibacter sp.]|nr:MlaD family protein [Ramlibacter sp.]